MGESILDVFNQCLHFGCIFGVSLFWICPTNVFTWICLKGVSILDVLNQCLHLDVS